jgi:hypothetical protein
VAKKKGEQEDQENKRGTRAKEMSLCVFLCVNVRMVSLGGYSRIVAIGG